MKIKLIFFWCFFSVSSVLWADDKAPTLQQALVIPKSESVSKSINPMRFEALRSTGLEYGLQAGLSFQYEENIKKLDSISEQMTNIYPFQSLMMEGNVIPPIISEVLGVYDQQSSTMIRLADKERTIIAPPRFSHTAPSYRDYFMHDFTFTPSAFIGVVPKNTEEEQVWKTAVTEGYAAGRAQAIKIFSDDNARLDRDFNGMRLYHQLLNAGKVTRPYVVVAHSGVTGDKNTTMKEGESFLEISATPEFVMNSDEWKVDLSVAIRKRLEVLVEPTAGAELVKKSGVVKESKSLSLEKRK